MKSCTWSFDRNTLFLLRYISMHASAISSLIVADWPLHYIIQNFKQFFPSSPGISTTHRAHSIDAAGGCRYVQTLSFSTAADHKQLSYRRETALQGALVSAKSGRLELGDIILGHYKYSFNNCDIIGLQSYRVRWKSRKIRAVTSFKVIEIGTHRKLVGLCDFLLIITDILSRTVSDLSQLIVQIL